MVIPFQLPLSLIQLRHTNKGFKMKFKPGLIYGSALTELYQYAKENKFAIPAVNVIGTDSVNGVLETAKIMNSPVIIQFSNGGGQFYAGKGIGIEGNKAAALG